MTANKVDRILNASVSDVGSRIAKAIEDQWFEKKSARVGGQALGQALVAFANAEGGVIVVGVHNGAVEGVNSEGTRRVNELRQASIDHTSPPVRFSCNEVTCINKDGKRDALLVFRVDPGERVHEMKNGDCYLRVGDETRKLNYSQRQELEFDKGQAQYDGMPVSGGYTVADLKQSLLENYRGTTGAKSTEGILHARSLLTRDGALTNAGMLLFGKHPQRAFPEAYIRVLRYMSPERGTGSQLNLYDGGDIKIEGPIPTAIQQAAKVIEQFAPKRRSLDSSGHFTGIDLVPRDAWLEGLVNAVIHRSYSLAGDHIRVEVFPDRIEIESPGRFPGLVDPSKPLEISRYARNPRIARVCADLRIGQELGEGIKRIFDEMRKMGLTDPVYRQGTGSVRLRLEAIPRLAPEVAARLPKGSQAILDVLRVAASPMGTGEIAEALNMSRPTASTRLQALRDEGLIEWIGKSPRDPRAAWALVTPS
ncbi:RecG-like DNA helicase [Mycobacterium phage Squirty]|uniref:RecG-like DNA helicase n=1 Tax=Mycobacterium phage Squirty TaxID=1527512 RepID=A0A088F7M4_9CAUD|nr:DNA helicase [Mycobacterium phage Squirty]AIM40978.1 RecG-like DNA helicase [Mycobacterium phage Squirty]